MTSIQTRKKQHVEIIKKNPVEPFDSSFDYFRLPYRAIPEIDMGKITTEVKFWNKSLSFPFLISSMTGGEKYGKQINTNIAIAAESEKIAIGLGSMRILDRHPEALPTFDVKRYCPSIPLFANIGIVQLNYGFDYDKIQRLVDMIKADGIFFHINHLQEAIQPEGDTNFESLIPKLEKVIKKLKIPVIAKETGHGIDKGSAYRLKEIGINWIDVSGTGGTSWAWVESYRSRQTNFGQIFKYEGISTAECLLNLNNLDLNLIAGGGIRNGLHVAKSIAMGAQLATAAKPFMDAALESETAVIELLKKYKKELVVAMFSSGSANIESLKNCNVEKIDPYTNLKI